MKNFYVLDGSNKVIKTRQGVEIVEGEVEDLTGTVEIGLVKQGNIFITPIDLVVEPEPTQLDRIETKLDQLLARA